MAGSHSDIFQTLLTNYESAMSVFQTFLSWAIVFTGPLAAYVILKMFKTKKKKSYARLVE